MKNFKKLKKLNLYNLSMKIQFMDKVVDFYKRYFFKNSFKERYK